MMGVFVMVVMVMMMMMFDMMVVMVETWFGGSVPAFSLYCWAVSRRRLR